MSLTIRPASVARKWYNVKTLYELKLSFFDLKEFSIKHYFQLLKWITSVFVGEGMVFWEFSKEKWVTQWSLSPHSILVENIWIILVPVCRVGWNVQNVNFYTLFFTIKYANITNFTKPLAVQTIFVFKVYSSLTIRARRPLKWCTKPLSLLLESFPKRNRGFSCFNDAEVGRVVYIGNPVCIESFNVNIINSSTFSTTLQKSRLNTIQHNVTPFTQSQIVTGKVGIETTAPGGFIGN